MPQGLALRECTGTWSTVPGFLFADTNPKAAGIFSASCCFLPHTPAGLLHPHWLSDSRAHTHTHKHTQMNTDRL